MILLINQNSAVYEYSKKWKNALAQFRAPKKYYFKT